MIKGLLWLPLLAVFIGLAWAGWNEYQKLEAYQAWAKSFDRAKYDIYAVLGQTASELTWGKPTRKGPIALQTFSLKQVKQIYLWVDEKRFAIDTPPDAGRQIALEFCLEDATIRVPFTELSLAIQWGQYLQRDWQNWQI